jgi:hypothetical protein
MATTRQTIERDPRNPEPHLDSGYEGDSPVTDFAIAPAGIEDADVALFNLFDKDIGFSAKNIASANKKIAIKKPFVIFATGERFAVAKRLRPPRDRNKQIMLPAISIRRKSFTQTSEDINGRGINQFTGTLRIKRRITKEQDLDYQNFINKLALKNMDNSRRSSLRANQGEAGRDPEIASGGLLSPRLGNNMWEIITIPQPQFFTTTYEVVFWTSYTQHMNYLIETLVGSFLPQVRGYKLTTDKGYWFMAYVGDSFSGSDNLDDFSEDSRILRYTFEVTIKGFILAPNPETGMVPIRREVLSPVVVFDTFPTADIIPKSHLEKNEALENKDKYVLNDIDQAEEGRQTSTTLQRYASHKEILDPRTGRLIKKTVSILESNQKKGETVFYASDQETLDEFLKTP